MSVKRKYKKLVKNPKLFFIDMLKKYKEKLSKVTSPKKIVGTNQYTIVSAVYGVEQYLNDFFKSIVKQSLFFKKNIYLIMVDDGSLDNSAIIIKKWQRKYPNNIVYLHKANGGQASARNLGLKHVKTKWVTFIDPDDFISRNYFKEIDDVLSKQPHISLVSVAIGMYNESSGIYRYDATPLAYCFKKDVLVPLSDMQNKIQLSVCTAIFDYETITKAGLEFDVKIKPSFEDGKFVADYLLESDKGSAYFLDTAYYYYRTRSDNSSTTDTQWEKVEKYADVFKYGYIPMFKEYSFRYSRVPENIQRTFLYFAIQYLKRIIFNKGSIDFLTQKQKKDLINYFHECFSYIDIATIMKFHLLGCSFFYKYGMINCFKNDEPSFHMVYIDGVDYEKELIKIRCYGRETTNFNFFVDGKNVLPSYIKKICHNFISHNFLIEIIYEISFSLFSDRLTITSNKPVNISFERKEYRSTILFKNILSLPGKQITEPWLFIDKDIKADDNAEHFYRYMAKEHPNQNIYFALREGSSDWNRLSKEFNLVAFGSKKFERILKSSSVVLSSHADRYLMAYFGGNTLKDKKFVFLQHGVIKHDLSVWLNNVPKIDCFITSTLPEYNYIGGEEGPYKYTQKEVVLTGLARHDNLLERSKKTSTQKTILLMGTWRNTIVGKLKENSTEREINSDFMNTNYFRAWSSLLYDKRFEEILNTYGFNVVFLPHPNIEPYLNEFKFPSYVNVINLKDNDYSIQDAFLEAAFLITDYSSVTFDMAYLGKGTLYYQFDSEDVLEKSSHTSSKGYFDYFNDGFGMVSYNLDSLLKDVEVVLANNGNVPTIYKQRMEKIFISKDGRNCERIYNAVIELFQKDCHYNVDIIFQSIKIAIENKTWRLALEISERLLNIDKYNRKGYLFIAYILYKQKDKNEILRYFSSKIIDSDTKLYFLAMYFVLGEQWDLACFNFEKLKSLNKFQRYLLLLSRARSSRRNLVYK